MVRPVDPASKRQRILKLHAEGRSPKEIARALDIPRPGYVYEVLYQAGVGRHRNLRVVIRMTAPEAAWLEKEAAEAKVTKGEMLRAIIVDAMEDAR